MQEESPIGTPKHWVMNADEIKECKCDPSMHIATDVQCKLESHKCETGSIDECLGNNRVHRTIRVKHIKGATEHRHHKCAFDSASNSCRCCDCTRVTRATNGCPCGAAENFLSRAWQMGTTKYWWSFKPKAGTTTCEVRGELKRGGWARGTADGDVYADGALAVRNGRLSFKGAWTQPSDINCPNLGAIADPELAWAALDNWDERNTECGFMHFFVTPNSLDGEWRYKSWPRQESWDVNWRPPIQSVRCTAGPATTGIPSCSILHENTLFPLSGGPTCWSRPMPSSAP
jgi:hypothetical protein